MDFYAETISSISEIKENIETLRNYIYSDDSDEIEYAKERIKQGRCFVVVKYNDSFQFFPSRFIGYKNNTMGKHENEYRYGGDSNRIISKTLNSKLEPNNIFEEQYKDFCEELGIKIANYKRKYWSVIL